MKKYFYYICFLLLLFLISILPASAKEIKTCVRTETNLRVREKFFHDNNLEDILKTPCVNEVDKVYDFADLLTDEEEEDLFSLVNSYIKKSQYDLVLVTTNENNKESEVSYADDFYDYNYFGFNETRDGVLILIDMSLRKVYISTTGYAIKMYDDFRIDDIIENGYDDLKEANYYESFSKMIESLEEYFNLDYPDSNEDLIIDEDGNPFYIKKIPYGILFIISCLITLVVSLVLYYKSVLKIKALSTISYLKDKKVTTKTDHLVNTTVTHTLRVNDTSSGGHSSSGGSSFHSSSSGSSHGGGGRSF